MRQLFLAAALVLGLAASSAAAPRQPAAPVLATADYLREAALTELFELKAAELAAEQARSAAVMSLGIRLTREQAQATEQLSAAATAAGLTAPPAELDATRAARIAELAALRGPAFDRAFLAGRQSLYEQALALHAGYAASGDQPALRDYAARAAARVRRHMALLKAM